MKDVTLESEFGGTELHEERIKLQHVDLAKHSRALTQLGRRELEENGNSNALSTGQSSSRILEQGQSSVDDFGISSASTICPAPICRQFWKAGNYDDYLGSKVTLQIGIRNLQREEPVEAQMEIPESDHKKPKICEDLEVEDEVMDVNLFHEVGIVKKAM